MRALHKHSGHFTFDPGFTSTCSTESQITFIDGQKGQLLYRGYPIEQLAEKSDFLEVAYLLINGELPSKAEDQRFKTRLRTTQCFTTKLKASSKVSAVTLTQWR